MSHPNHSNQKPILLTASDVIEDSEDNRPKTDQEQQKNALAWGFGVFFAIGSITCGNPLMFLVWITMAAVLIPPTRAKIEEVAGIELDSGMIKKILIGGGVATIVLAMMMSVGSMSDGGASDAQWDKWIDRVGDIGSPMP